MEQSEKPYHHGDLRSALVCAAVELLEEGGEAGLSLRAAARRAGVSTAAPYRHFADREALLSAVAAIGYRELAADMRAARPDPASVEDLVEIAVAYVLFALKRPGLFRAMFIEPCDPTSPERVAAVAAIRAYLGSIVQRTLPSANAEAMETAAWALVHGLACLYLAGKFDGSSDGAVADQVRAALRALFETQNPSGAKPQ